MHKQLITSPRRVARLVAEYHRKLNAGYNDPMTEHYGAQEFVGDACRASLRKALRATAYGPEAAEELACNYWQAAREKRFAYRDPARLRWREQQRWVREQQNCYPEFDDIPF